MKRGIKMAHHEKVMEFLVRFHRDFVKDWNEGRPFKSLVSDYYRDDVVSVFEGEKTIGREDFLRSLRKQYPAERPRLRIKVLAGYSHGERLSVMIAYLFTFSDGRWQWGTSAADLRPDGGQMKIMYEVFGKEKSGPNLAS
ncbi:hypothetical protein KC722_00980 [Candidatus Kaiserbacteria bacterium]|nr:hypothetical protein [Candidatus Kaiserbacteria bacterium]